MFETLAAAMREFQTSPSEDAVWRTFGGFMEAVGVPIYVVARGGDDSLSTHEKILFTNVPVAVIDKLDGAATGVRPIRRMALQSGRSFLLSERRHLLQSDRARHWLDIFSAVAGGMDLLVVPVQLGVAGIGLMCGPAAVFDDARVAALVTITNAAFEARARVAPAEDGAHDDGGDWRPRLTPRQKCILGFVSEGLSEEEIATTLDISRRTVRFHLNDARGRLGVATRRLAVDRARRLGLLGG